MERVWKYIDHMGLYAAALLKWIVVGGLVGGVDEGAQSGSAALHNERLLLSAV